VVRLPDGAFAASDARCFHMGGSLQGGDIEDLGSAGFALRCPEHHRRISLLDGREIVPPDDATPSWSFSGVPVQRVHTVDVDPDGGLYLNVSGLDMTVASDAYNASDAVAERPRKEFSTPVKSSLAIGTESPPSSTIAMRARKRRAVEAVAKRSSRLRLQLSPQLSPPKAHGSPAPPSFDGLGACTPAAAAPSSPEPTLPSSLFYSSTTSPSFTVAAGSASGASASLLLPTPAFPPVVGVAAATSSHESILHPPEEEVWWSSQGSSHESHDEDHDRHRPKEGEWWDPG